MFISATSQYYMFHQLCIYLMAKGTSWQLLKFYCCYCRYISYYCNCYYKPCLRDIQSLS